MTLTSKVLNGNESKRLGTSESMAQTQLLQVIDLL